MNERLPHLCFAICRFSQVRFISQATSRTISFSAQMEGRREKERERKRKGKEEEGKEKGKGEREREIGSEALAETEKNRKRPSRESNTGPQQTRLMLYH